MTKQSWLLTLMIVITEELNHEIYKNLYWKIQNEAREILITTEEINSQLDKLSPKKS